MLDDKDDILFQVSLPVAVNLLVDIPINLLIHITVNLIVCITISPIFMELQVLLIMASRMFWEHNFE